MPGRDNKFAILPEELKQLNEHIKNRQEALTNHGVDFQDIEQGARDEYRGRFNKGLKQNAIQKSIALGYSHSCILKAFFVSFQ